ncbi:MAG: peptide deformylase [Candidatus Spechtbacterales bacterium]
MFQAVIQEPNPILHKKTLPITGGFDSPFMKKLIKNMGDTLAKQDGVGLAAPQINESLSIFVIPDNIAPKVRMLNIPFSLIKPLWPTVFVNPEIVYYSDKKEVYDEGCLSLRGIFKPTPRSHEVKIRARDHLGRKFTVYAKGLLARVFQHEIDHLNGTLFIERV